MTLIPICCDIPLAKGGRISLIRLNGGASGSHPLILAHGTLSNAGTMMDLGKYLADKGHDIWLLEWGGHGNSRAARSRQNFEYPALNDLPLAIAYVKAETGASKVCWIGHSGGGLLALMYLARFPEQQRNFSGLVTLGSQSTSGAVTLRHKLRAISLYGLTMAMGRTPRVFKPMGDEGEPTSLLAQWAIWNLTQKWRGRDGFDYQTHLGRIQLPSLVIAGARDVIAPAKGCARVFDALGTNDKTWINVSRAKGFSRDAAHGQLVKGRTAQREIYPRIREWVAEIKSRSKV